MRAPLIAIVLVCTLLLWSCGGSGSLSPTISYREISAMVGPEGGLIGFPGEAELQVPPGALIEASSIRLRLWSAPLQQSPVCIEHPASIEAFFPTSALRNSGSLQLTIHRPVEPGEGSWAAVFGKQTITGCPDARPMRLDNQRVAVEIRLDEMYRSGDQRGDEDSTGFAATFGYVPSDEAGWGHLKRPRGGQGIVLGSTKLEMLPANTDLSGARLAVIVHGLNNNADDVIDLGFIAQQASRGTPLGAYSAIIFFNYHDNTNHIDESGRRLAQLLRQHGAMNAQFIDFYGHSMGGLVSRWVIEKEGFGVVTQRLLAFGTPHQGVPSKIMNYIRWLFDGIEDLSSDSDFLAELNRPPSPFKDRVVYCTFAGENYYYVKAGVDVGNLIRKKYREEPDPYLGPIDGIVAQRSASPKEMMPNFGTWDEVRSNCLLDYNHSDIGGSFENNAINIALIAKVKEYLSTTAHGVIR